MITTAEEYKQALLDIQKGVTVVRTTLPSTEPRIPIDLDTRQISIPDEFKFLATKKETKAETIYFVCDRYFDDIDLSTKTCVVQWVNTDGKITNRGLYPVTEIDTNSVDGKIVFGWTIQSESTQIAGRIEFAITFYEINEDKTIDQSVFEYNLTTLATSSLVLDTLDIWGSTTPPGNPTELQVWLNKINSIAKEANDNNNDTKAKIKEFNDNFSGKLTDINNTATSQIDAINSVGRANIRSVNDVGKQNVDSVSNAGSQNINRLNDTYTENLKKFNNNAYNVYNDKVSSINQVASAKISDINGTALSQIDAINNSTTAQIHEIENHGNDILDNLGIVNNTKLYTDIYFDCQSYNRFMITSFTIDGNDVIKNGKGEVFITKLKADGSTIVDKMITLPTDCAFNTEINIGNCAKIKIRLGYYRGESNIPASFTYALYSDYSDVTNKCDETINTLNNLAYLSIDETEDVVDEINIKNELISATERANNAAKAAEDIVANKIGINDSEIGNGTTYSSNKIEAMLKVLSTNRPKEWGVRFPLYTAGSNPKGERLGDAIGLVANVGTDTVDAYNDFDYLMPWKSRRVNGHWDGKDFVVTAVEGEPNFAVDGSNGNVYAERHLFYYKYVFTDTYYEIWISDQHLDGYEIPERFINLDGSVMDTYYYPCYKIGLDSSGNPVSYSGMNTMLSRSYDGYKSLLRSKLGTNYHTETTKDRQINELLFYVEFATRNSQDIMYGVASMRYDNANDVATVATTNGNKFICANDIAANYVIGQTIVIGSSKNGSDIANNRRITAIETHDASNKAIVFDGTAANVAAGNFISSRCWFSGGSDSVLTPSGSAVSNSSGKYQMRYRYVEDLWGNQWSIMADVLINDCQTYVCKDSTKFANSITSDYEQIGYVNCSSEGWTKELGWDAEHPYVRLPIVVGGASSQYFCDYYWHNTGLRVVYVGGSLYNGAYAGLVCWRCYYAVDSAYWDIATRFSYTA